MKDIEYEPKKTSDTLDYTEFDDFLEALGSEISWTAPMICCPIWKAT